MCLSNELQSDLMRPFYAFYAANFSSVSFFSHSARAMLLILPSTTVTTIGKLAELRW